MRISLGLPTHRVDLEEEFVSGAAIVELARAAEDGGFDAVYVTEHPFPEASWLKHGGHHALDPFVALSFAAAVTSRIRLQTNLVVLSYRNPFLSAKAIASLDALSGGRTIIGIGAGYLEGEFLALGVDPAQRNELTDDAIRAMTAAWSGEVIEWEGVGYNAPGNVDAPAAGADPASAALDRWQQQPRHAPCGRAGRRLDPDAHHGDVGCGRGQAPEDPPVGQRCSTRGARSSSCTSCVADAGRTDLPTVAFTPPSLLLAHAAAAGLSAQQMVDEAGELADAGVSQLTISLPAESRRTCSPRWRSTPRTSSRASWPESDMAKAARRMNLRAAFAFGAYLPKPEISRDPRAAAPR